MLEPFISGGLAQLRWLIAADRELDSDIVIAEQDPAYLIGSALIDDQEWMAGQFQWRPALVEVFDQSYNAHLRNHMRYFAQPSSKVWADGMKAYVDEVEKGVKIWGTAERARYKKVEGVDLPPDLEHLLVDLPKRVRALLENKVMAGYPFVPNVPGGVPLLCPAFLCDLYRVFDEISPALSLVSRPLI